MALVEFIKLNFQKHNNMPQTKEQKRESAKKRNAEYNALSPQLRLQVLDGKFGFNQGAKKERAKLTRLIEEQKPNKN